MLRQQQDLNGGGGVSGPSPTISVMEDIRVAETGPDGIPTVLEVLVGGEWVRKEIVPDAPSEKHCRNCNKQWPPEYMGQCDACGASMAFSGPTPSLASNGDVNGHLASLRRSAGVSGAFATRQGQTQGAGDTSHPGVAHIKSTADPYAKEVLEDLFA